MCFKNHPLVKPALQWNPDFLNMATEWTVEFHMPGLFFMFTYPIIDFSHTSSFLLLFFFFLSFLVCFFLSLILSAVCEYKFQNIVV